MRNNSIPEVLQTASPQAWGGISGRFFSLMQFLYSVSVNFSAHNGTLRAAALTYTTILSLVPFLAIVFAVLKGLGAQNALEPVLQNFVGDSGETISRIIAYVNNTNVKSMGVIGLVMLIVTVISLMGSIDEAFNAVWGVKETRSMRRRFSDYLSVVIAGPILLLVATSMTSSLQSQWVLKWLIQNTYFGDAVKLLFQLVPYLSVWLAMVLLYMFIPNTKIRTSSAIIGGVVAGTAWELAQWGYFHFQVGVANYNAIYGTLAAVPVFLVWVYTSWLIVLFGLEIVFAHQHGANSFFGCAVQQLSAAEHEKYAVALLIQVNVHFLAGGVPPTSQLLADELNVPLLHLVGIVAELEKSGFLIATSANDTGWLPARDCSEVLVCDVLEAMRGSNHGMASSPVMQLAENTINEVWNSGRNGFAGVTVRNLLMNSAPLKNG